MNMMLEQVAVLFRVRVEWSAIFIPTT